MTDSRLGGPLEQAAAAAVRDYLDALRTAGHCPGPHLSRGELRKRLAKIDLDLAVQPPPMIQLRLIQERANLRARADWQRREDAFVEVALTYSRRHGITHETWRQVGVPAAVLRRARIPTRRSDVRRGGRGAVGDLETDT
jgi:hypothetical protein